MKNPSHKECLFVCYNADGAVLRDAVARHICARHPFRTTSLDLLGSTPFLTSAHMVDVYPVLMQTGQAVRRILPARLQTVCHTPLGQCPEFRFHPVWGASPELPFHALPPVRKALADSDTALLIIAHGHQSDSQADEPKLFTNALSKLLSASQTVRLCWFGVKSNLPTAADIIPTLTERRIVVLPFLAGRGMHFRNDMPTPHHVALWGKELTLLPPLGEISAAALDNPTQSNNNARCHENENR